MHKAAQAEPRFVGGMAHVSLHRQASSGDSLKSNPAHAKAAQARARGVIRDAIIAILLAILLILCMPGRLHAQDDCLACHSDKDMKYPPSHTPPSTALT